MKQYKKFLTSTARKECSAYLFDKGLVDKEKPTIVQISSALSKFTDEDLTKLATDLGYSEESSSENFDNLVSDLGFADGECGKFKTPKGLEVAIVNATYSHITNGRNLAFKFSKGMISVNNTTLLELATKDKLEVGKQYPIKMDTIIPSKQPGWFIAQAVETAFDGVQEIYAKRALQKDQIKQYKKNMRTLANASQEDIDKGVQDILSSKLQELLSF